MCWYSTSPKWTSSVRWPETPAAKPGEGDRKIGSRSPYWSPRRPSRPLPLGTSIGSIPLRTRMPGWIGAPHQKTHARIVQLADIRRRVGLSRRQITSRPVGTSSRCRSSWGPQKLAGRRPCSRSRADPLAGHPVDRSINRRCGRELIPGGTLGRGPTEGMCDGQTGR